MLTFWFAGAGGLALGHRPTTGACIPMVTELGKLNFIIILCEDRLFTSHLLAFNLLSLIL